MKDWLDIRTRITALGRLDRTFQSFGARTHRYAFNPPASADDIQQWQTTHNAELPASLVACYTVLGNGGAGPDYGVLPLHKLNPLTPDKPFLGCAALKKLAQERNNPDDDDNWYWFESDHDWGVPDDALTGLLPVIDAGCGTHRCVVCAGPLTDQSVRLTSDLSVIDLPPLIDQFDAWLTREFELFGAIERLLKECSSSTELKERFRAEHNAHGGLDYMVSFLGCEKPAALFGEAENRFHGASQFPWYEKQFKRHTKRRKFPFNLF